MITEAVAFIGQKLSAEGLVETSNERREVLRFHRFCLNKNMDPGVTSENFNSLIKLYRTFPSECCDMIPTGICKSLRLKVWRFCRDSFGKWFAFEVPGLLRFFAFWVCCFKS